MPHTSRQPLYRGTVGTRKPAASRCIPWYRGNALGLLHFLWIQVVAVHISLLRAMKRI